MGADGDRPAAGLQGVGEAADPVGGGADPAWLGRCRRLSKDRERGVLSSETFVTLAMIHLMPRRLRPGKKDAPFRYKRAA